MAIRGIRGLCGIGVLRCCYDPTTTMKIRLRLVYADCDAAATLLRPSRWGYAFVAQLYPFYIKSEVQLIYVQLTVNDRRNQMAMLQLAIMNHSLIMFDAEVQARRRRRAKRSWWSVHVYPQTDGYNLGTITN